MTAQLFDILTGAGAANPDFLTDVNGTVFFVADDGAHGRELWKSDGTAAGTVLLRDIRSGGEGSNPYYLTNVNGTLFFEADDGLGEYPREQRARRRLEPPTERVE